jgi:hypothetical protein
MKGFAVCLQLETNVKTGLAAIDLRRQLGLADGTMLWTSTCGMHYPIEDEGFIRQWFNPSNPLARATIKLEWLVRGQYYERENAVKLYQDLPEVTVKALFIRAKFAALQADLERAEKLLAEAASATQMQEPESAA